MTALIIDQFAGGGGASSGIEAALGRAVDYAINHDREAIALHRVNHPRTEHRVTSVWDVSPQELCAGRPVDLMWASPDCTFHSKARGAKPFRERDTARRRRGLAGIIPRWMAAVRPRVVAMENVEEFSSWCPLLPNGKPDPAREGLNFRRWVKQIQNLGYAVDMRELRACEYGAPTTRKRLFIICRCDGKEIVFPDATHGGDFSYQKPYRTAAECIDWSIPCPSIFERERPLADATLRRIARGVMRYVVNDPKPYIVQVAHGDWGHRDGARAWPIDQPLGTVSAGGIQHAVVQPFLAPLTHHDGSNRARPLTQPLPTITGAQRGELALVTPIVVGTGHVTSGAPQVWDADAPLRTITTGGRFAVAAATLINTRNGERHGRHGEQAPRVLDIQAPYPTVTAQGSQGAVVAASLEKHSGGFPGHAAEVVAFLVAYYGTGDNSDSLRQPVRAITTRDRLGLVTVHGEDYRIVDIGMRMLTPRELYRAQGFRPDYIIEQGIDELGAIVPLTKTAQVRMVGNSVSPPVAEALVRSNVIEQRASDAA